MLGRWDVGTLGRWDAGALGRWDAGWGSAPHPAIFLEKIEKI